MSIDIKRVEEKYKSVLDIKASINDSKIRLEASIDSLKKEIEERMGEVRERTGAETLEDAIKVYKEREAENERKLEEFNKKLDAFIDAYGEAEEDGVIDEL